MFKSSDAGGNWTAINSGLGHPAIYSVLVDPSDSSTLYAGTGSGVYTSTDAGANWVAINTGLSYPWVSSLAISPVDRKRLYAGTFGRGVFGTELQAEDSGR
jgi:hypothetical protein